MATASTSGAANRLVEQKSQFNSAVTLFTLDSLQVKEEDDDRNEPPFTPRRSKRIKLDHKNIRLEKTDETEEIPIPDLEDLKSNIALSSRHKRSGNEKSMKQVKKEVKEEATNLTSPLSPLSSAPSSPDFPNAKASLSKASLKKSPSKKQKPIPQALATPHPAPLNWKQTFDTVKEMRSKITAPVDTMGCAQAQYKETDPHNQRFSTLVSLMLSSQTKDEVTDAAVSKLRTAVGGTLSIDAIIDADPSTISDAINKVGFWRRKSQYIKQTAQRLRDDFGSDVPKTVDELCSLPGVGPKMAFLALQVAWNLNHGIGVDVHVHRITNRLGWHKKPTKNPEETRLNLQSWLPKEHHREINDILVGFGQVICLPVNPKCDECELSSKGLCPSAQVRKPGPSKSRKRKAVLIEEDSAGLDQDAGSPSIAVKIELEAAEELVREPGVATLNTTSGATATKTEGASGLGIKEEPSG